MDGQYTSSGFQLYGQPLQTASVQPGGQMTQPAPQQVGGYTLIPAAGTGQPTLANLRSQPVQILQQATPAPPKTQQSGIGAVSFQQPAPGQTQQTRIQPAQLQGLTSQQLQFLQTAQQTGQLTSPGLPSFSQPAQQLGAIQILQPKAQPSHGAARPFNQGQPALQGMQQVLPQAVPQSLQPAQGLQGLGMQQVPGLAIPGVQVLQQYPGFNSQVNTAPQPKPTAVGSGFQPTHHQTIGATSGAGTGRHTGSLFSNSNQRGNYGQQRYGWSDRDRNDRSELRYQRDRLRRDDRGPFGSHNISVRDPIPPRMARDRELFRHDRGRERFDRGGGRDYNRRMKDFSKERKPSPIHHPYDFKKEDVRKDQRRDILPKPVLSATKDVKTPVPPPLPPIPKPPPAADYIVKVPQVPFVTYERDYSDIARRYTHLHVSPDFTRLICHWVKCDTSERYPYGCCLCPLNKPVKFEMVQGPHEGDVEIVLPATKNEIDAPTKWNAKCTFMSGLDDKNFRDVLKGKFDGGTHLINALKFVTVREEKDKKKTGIMCLGGPYDPAIDDGNPEQSEDGLKNACIRHVKAQTLLDLTPCTTWIRFCDIHYSRLDASGRPCQEVTVIFLVDITAIVPSEEDWPSIWKEQHEWKQKALQLDLSQTVGKTDTDAAPENVTELGKDVQMEATAKEAPGVNLQASASADSKMEEVPSEVSVLMKCRSAKNGRVKTMSISLDGLLDYDESDKDEATFELSLMAEGMNEMLMRDYGSLILKALMEQRNSTTETPTDEKKRPVTALVLEVPEPQVKKLRQAEMPKTSEALEAAPVKETEANMAASEMDLQYQDSPGDIVHVGDIEEQPEVIMKEEPVTENAPAAKQDIPITTAMETKEEPPVADVEMESAADLVNEELLFAFRYFDRAGCGYVKCDDLRRLLHNLGCCLAPRVVRELVHGAAAMNKEKHDRVFYRTLTDKETST